MANIKHQVFLSATQGDLIEARRKAISSILLSDCFVASMEYFPATNEEQMDFIQTIIDECDFYLLIVGGRYGSLHSSGVSFTEREFDYAVSQEKPVLAFLHAEPALLPPDRRETDPERQARFDAFCEKVKAKRVVGLWRNEDELASQITTGLLRTRRMNPEGGWVRSSEAISTKTIERLTKISEENEELRRKIDEANTEISMVKSYNWDLLNEDFLLWDSQDIKITVRNLSMQLAGLLAEKTKISDAIEVFGDALTSMGAPGHLRTQCARRAISVMISLSIIKIVNDIDYGELLALDQSNLWRLNARGPSNT